MFQGQGLDLVIVHFPGVIVQAVLDGVVGLAGEVGLGAVGEVAPVGQAHAKNGITGITQGQEHSGIGLGTRVRLHIGVGGTKQRLGALDRQILSLIHILAAAIVALAGITFRVLVGQRCALRLHHTGAGVVLRGDQLDMLFLATLFLADSGENLVVESLDGHVVVKHGVPLAGSGSLLGGRSASPLESGAF